jgi:hypothetical protein
LRIRSRYASSAIVGTFRAWNASAVAGVPSDARDAVVSVCQIGGLPVPVGVPPGAPGSASFVVAICVSSAASRRSSSCGLYVWMSTAAAGGSGASGTTGAAGGGAPDDGRSSGSAGGVVLLHALDEPATGPLAMRAAARGTGAAYVADAARDDDAAGVPCGDAAADANDGCLRGSGRTVRAAADEDEDDGA